MKPLSRPVVAFEIDFFQLKNTQLGNLLKNRCTAFDKN